MKGGVVERETQAIRGVNSRDLRVRRHAALPILVGAHAPDVLEDGHVCPRQVVQGERPHLGDVHADASVRARALGSKQQARYGGQCCK